MALYCGFERVLHVCMVNGSIQTDADNDENEGVDSLSVQVALLVSVAKDRDKGAFVKLFEYFAPRVKSYLMSNGCTPEVADDLAQETMLAVWDKAPSYDPKKAAVSTWIFTIARNKRIDVLRKENRPAPHPDDPFFVEDVLRPDEYYDVEAEQRVVAEALKTLPEEQADLVRMNFFEDKSHADIAKETKLPLGTIKSRIRLAVGKLRKSVEDMGIDKEGYDGSK